ncbi:immunity 8 family protein [Comamonas sp.]|uniref:immunity 8 family protein n=1 Tax=Comamonas sp. TaxID=34028 RepID=UPI003D1510AF
MNEIIIKGIDFGSIDLDRFIPENPRNFCLWLTLSIGPKDSDGSHLFQVGVCTVTWLSHKLAAEHVFSLKSMILVEEFDFQFIKKKIVGIVASSQRSSWDESVQALSRYFSWEFEN